LVEPPEPGADRDASALLLHACALAATDFAEAVAWLQPWLPTKAASEILAFVSERLSVPDPGTVACTIYLLAQAQSADLAAAAGWHAVELGCDDDHVIIALADVLQMQTHPRQTAPAMMQQRASDRRSTGFLVKLADHYWARGQAFLAEDVLRDMIGRGRRDLMLRLGEHWFQQRNWRSARDLLQQLTPDQTTAYIIYLMARCSAALLLEDEVIQAIDALTRLPGPGPHYAALLRSVWIWRVGDPVAAVKSCPEGDFPPLVARDAVALRCANVTATPARLQAPTGIWRNIGSREDLPNVLGIGMQRTATSWLWRQLRKHPDVHARTFKELVFFNDPFGTVDMISGELRDADLGEAGDLYWQGPTRNLLHYRQMFKDRKPFRIDISPSYGEMPEEAVGRVREILGPDVKIILSVRDPVERSWSNLKLDLRWTGEHPLSLSFMQRTALYRNVATLRRCDYASILRSWRRFFHHIKIVFMDDVIASPNETLADLHGFLGLSSWVGDDPSVPVNITDTIDMPRDDRMFLFGLHQPTYQATEAELGGPALGWRQRQLALLSGTIDRDLSAA